MRRVEHAATADLSRRFKRIVRTFIESSASVAVLQHVAFAPWRPVRPPRALTASASPVPPSRQGAMSAFPRLCSSRSLALVAGAWLALAVWATPARPGARAAAAEAVIGDMAGWRPCSRPARPCRSSSPPTARSAAPRGSPARSASRRCRRAGWACSATARRSRAAEAAALGRHLADAAAGGRFSLAAAAGRLGADLPRRRRPGAGRLRRARGRLLWFIDVTEAEDAARDAGRAARAALGRARRSVRPDRGGALPDVASRPRPQARHGQRRLCRRGRGRGRRRRGPQAASS